MNERLGAQLSDSMRWGLARVRRLVACATRFSGITIVTPAASFVTKRALLLLLAGVFGFSAAELKGQGGAGLHNASRAELTARVDSLSSQLASGALRDKDARAQAERDVAELRLRLTEGDFRAGDRFFYTIVVDNVISDSASVRDDYMVSISTLPDVSVKGVLASELTSHLSAHVARYLKNATVRTSLLTRVSVVGTVLRPGVYHVAPNRTVGELVMLAGGPIQRTNMREFEVVRRGAVVMSKKMSRAALQAGQTIEQADIRSGDEIRVPATRQFRISWAQAVQILFVLTSLTLAFLQFIQFYYRE